MNPQDQFLVDFIKELKELVRKYLDKSDGSSLVRKEMSKLLLFYANICWKEKE